MATIEKSPILNKILSGTVGILQPQLSHRFALRFNGNRSTFSQDCFDFLSLQVIDLTLDLKNETLTVQLEQPLNNYDFFLTILNELAEMYDTTIDIVSSPVNVDDEIVVLLNLERCKLADHSFELNYAKMGTAKHKLVFKFDFKTVRDRIITQIYDLEKSREVVNQPETQPV